MVILVWEQDARIVGTSVYHHARDCAGTFFATIGGNSDCGVDHHLDNGGDAWKVGVVAECGGVVVDGACGKRVGVWLAVGNAVFGYMASGVGVFVYSVSVGSAVSDFAWECDYCGAVR